MSGYDKNGSKLECKKPLTEDEAMQIIYNHASHTNKQPAQNRLKRLQTNLKRVQDKKASKDKPDSKRSNQNASASATQTISSASTSGASHGRRSLTFATARTPEISRSSQSSKSLTSETPRTSQSRRSNAFAPSPSPLTSETPRTSQSRRSNAFAPSPSPLTPETPRFSQSHRSNAFAPSPSPLTSETPRTSQSRRSNVFTPSPLTLTPAKSIRERLRDQAKTWQKPKALLDSSNRLQSGSSTSANQRLTQLRASLEQQAKQETKERNNNDSPMLPPGIPNAFIGKKAKVVEPEPEPDSEPEPMDWEDCDLVILNRKSEDGELNELPARRLEHMYFVLDTNVLMHNCSFVGDLTKVVLPGTVGSMLFIPYIVIKELDRLKIRQNDDNMRREMAVRAIRFLNTKFDESLEIQAQSALEESEHLIEVDCGDDSIVNCCLQLQKEVPHMMLLTNDANLRLKAKSSAIPVSTHSDLKAAYPDEFAALD